MTEPINTAGIEHIGNPAFLREVDLMVATHKAKAAGYAGQDEPDTWANFREAESWGTTPLQGCFVRMGDKYRRIQNLRRNPDNDRVGESIKVTLRDLANYALIAVCLLEEEEQAALATKADGVMSAVGSIEQVSSIKDKDVRLRRLADEMLAQTGPYTPSDLSYYLARTGLKLEPDL